jgi:hypothetical protein
MKAELIHIQCGTFNGIANYKIGDKVLRFELGTPNYNDYGEYRVNTEFEILEFDEKYRGYVWPNHDIELSDEQVKWWLHDSDRELEEYMREAQIAGGKSENNFVIFDKTNQLIKYSDWEKLPHDPYEHFMFNVLNTFYHWMRSDDFIRTGQGGELYIFPKL